MDSEIKYYYDIEQGTEEWYKVRLGIPTASVISSLITATGKIANNQTVKNYALELASQRITKYIEESYQSFDMMRGHFQEEIARDIYSENITPVKECGFITREFEDFVVGASPDGLVGEDGGIEIKSRLGKFQVSTIINNEVPKEYMDQIQACLFVSGREWWDFIQYSNGMPLFIKRVKPDLERFELYKEALIKFEEMVKGYVAQYFKNSKGLLETERVDFMKDDIIVGGE